MTKEVVLQLIDAHSWQDAMHLTVRPEQQRFVADHSPVAAVGLAKAYVRPGGKVWLPYGIYAGATIVGFFMLTFPEKGNDDAWLFHFFIDQRYQGQGYGIQSMLKLIEIAPKVHPEGTGLCLVVDPENVAAQRLYERVGFRSTGELKWNEPVYRLELSA